ncbi:hypothetical protein DFQ27_005614 [Actinomortierella ambigua]|uniref:Pirin C-terminal domain-containing protein n=1 Tax=Actinomortierella ambigua TaxID=1343610 RepID=A0A9P6UC74_9FUNG|nr:hypothetical protein DFQ27_005614 [Actinomortierella ambigua]
MCEPQYQELLDKDTVILTNHALTTLLIRVQSPATTEIPEDFQGFIYTLSGTVYIADNHFKGEPHHTLTLSHDGKKLIRFETRDKVAHFVVITGRLLRDPVVQYGPFVMAAQDDIYATFDYYKSYTNGFKRALGWKSKIAQEK